MEPDILTAPLVVETPLNADPQQTADGGDPAIVGQDGQALAEAEVTPQYFVEIPLIRDAQGRIIGGGQKVKPEDAARMLIEKEHYAAEERQKRYHAEQEAETLRRIYGGQQAPQTQTPAPQAQQQSAFQIPAFTPSQDLVEMYGEDGAQVIARDMQAYMQEALKPVLSQVGEVKQTFTNLSQRQQVEEAVQFVDGLAKQYPAIYPPASLYSVAAKDPGHPMHRQAANFDMLDSLMEKGVSFNDAHDYVQYHATKNAPATPNSGTPPNQVAAPAGVVNQVLAQLARQNANIVTPAAAPPKKYEEMTPEEQVDYRLHFHDRHS